MGKPPTGQHQKAASNKPGPKRSITEREAALEQVAKLDALGFPQWKIAQHLGVCGQQIGYDLKQIRERYKAATLASRQEQVMKVLAGIYHVREEAYAAYLKSMEPGEKTVTKTRTTPGGISEEEAHEVVGQNPGNEYLQTILQTFKQERELLGLDEALKVEHTGNVVIDWHAMTLRPVIKLDDDHVEKRIAEEKRQVGHRDE
jgi:hypothetical protein